MHPLAQTALNQVFELHALLDEDMSRSFERDGLTSARAHLLWVLHEQGPSTQKVLADELRVSPRNITGLVDGLESSGLVARSPHPTDRRATLVAFTDAGARLAGEMARGQKELADGLFGGLPETELAGFTATLGGVVERLKQLMAEAYGPLDPEERG